MRKLIVSTLSAGTLVVAASLVAQPAAVADPDAGQTCQLAHDFGFSHGACVNLFNHNFNGAVAASTCKMIQQNDSADFSLAFKNLGACVSTFVQSI